MLVEQVKTLTPLQRLVYWIQERESIRLRKKAGEPPPWTDDIILQSYRFTNVRRMDDKVSQWLLTNWYKPYKDHPNMLVACALARFINNPRSLEVVGFPRAWNPAKIKARLRGAKKVGTVFNAAYMVRGNDGRDKISAVVDHYVNPLYKDRPEIVTTSMQRTWANLECRYGLGSFMAGQVVADLRHAVTGRWSDKHSWAPLGPGSMKGMNRLHSRHPKTPLHQHQFLDELRELREQLWVLLPESLTRRLEMFDIQNCLCELSKYEKTLWGEGRPKQLYNGVTCLLST